MKHCVPIQNFFHILDQLYLFMHWSHVRHGTFVEVLEKSVVENKNLKPKNFSKMRLKSIRTTRSGSKHEACKTLKACFTETIQCLEQIKNDRDTDAEYKTMATGLKSKMFTTDFIAILEICSTIFDMLAPTTTMLQGIMIDFGSASSIINYTVQALRALRTDES